jgi:ATP-binding cassette subfamily B protein
MSFPFFKQLDTMDCGPTCLKIIAKYYGREYDLNFLREKCYTNKEGVSILGIGDAAENIGLRTNAVKLTWEQLMEDVKLPCIIHWNQKHFVVVYKITKEKKRENFVLISDPAQGLLKYEKEKFMKSWATSTDEDGDKAGIALLIEPTPVFFARKTIKPEKLRINFLLKYFKQYKKNIAILVTTVIIGCVINLIFPFLMQAIVDNGIKNKNIHFILIVLMAQMMLVIGQAINDFIRNRLMLYTTTRIGISLISDFLSKLMRLPIAFFDRKIIGDISQRIDDYGKVQSFLTVTLLSIMTSIIVLFVYGFVMAKYNIQIMIIFILFSIFYIIWILLFMKKRKKLEYMRFQESALNQSHIYQLMNDMQEIKLNNYEKQRRWNWEKTQANLFKISIESLTLGQKQEIGALFIDQTKNIIIIFWAAQSVVNGEITLGMMMALQYIIGVLNTPLTQFIHFVQSIQDAKISLERLNEIQIREDEEPPNSYKIKKIPIGVDIVLKNVSFQYGGPRSERILKNIDLVIPTGKITAIVGSSGSGKTTLLKLLLKFYKPTQGEIYLGDKSLELYSEKAWRRECGTVMQEGKIFSETILNNIVVSDEYFEKERLLYAITVSNISSFINNLPLGFNTKIGDDGIGLSTGQKQRILIARSVYKNANYLFFDEATNSLDATNEKKIIENLSAYFTGKTVIIVAHRLSTVKNADQIIVLDNGEIVESGNHKTLTKLKGKYYQLVKNQLELGS